MRPLRIVLQILLPVLILGGGGGLAWWIANQRPEVKVEPRSFVAPAVRVHAVTAASLRIDVATQGTVEPHRAIQLAAQVGGRAIAVAPALRAGGFFEADELLVEIDASDYRLAVTQREADVARAELRLLQERAEAVAAIRAWIELEGEPPTDPLVRREPQIEEADKMLAAARAQLERARLDLDRTRVKAPFAGRVRRANVDTGQIVLPGTTLADIYAIDQAEVRLPIPADDAAFLDLPLHWADSTSAPTGPEVVLTATFAGRRHEYAGRIVRTDGEVDRRTQQITLIARVEAPYARNESGDRPPLAIGTFVEARVRGSRDGQRRVDPARRAARRGHGVARRRR